MIYAWFSAARFLVMNGQARLGGKLFAAAADAGRAGPDAGIDAAIPGPHGAVGVGDRAEAAELEEAAFIAKSFGEMLALVIPETLALFVNEPREKRRGPAHRIHRRDAHLEHMSHGAQQPVGMARTAGDQNGGRVDALVFQILRHADGAGGIVFRRRDAAERRAGADGNHRLGRLGGAKQLRAKRLAAKRAGLRHSGRDRAFGNQNVTAGGDDFVHRVHSHFARGAGQGLVKGEVNVLGEQFDGADGFGIQQRNGAAGAALALQPQHRGVAGRQLFGGGGQPGNRAGAQAHDGAQLGAQFEKGSAA